MGYKIAPDTANNGLINNNPAECTFVNAILLLLIFENLGYIENKSLTATNGEYNIANGINSIKLLHISCILIKNAPDFSPIPLLYRYL